MPMLTPEESRVSPTWIGFLWLAFGTFVFQLLIVLESFVAYFAPDDAPVLELVGSATGLAASQFQNLCVSVNLGVLFLLAGPFLWARLLVWATAVVHLVYLLANQVFYSVFFTHFRPGTIEVSGFASLAHLRDSIAFEVGTSTYANAALLLVLVVVWARYLWPAQRFSRPRLSYWKWKAWLILGLALLLALYVVPSPKIALSDLSVHPLVALAASLVDSSERGRPDAPEQGDIDLYTLRHGAYGPEPEAEAVLGAVRQAVAERSSLPNIVLVVLESVGAGNLLRDGLPDPDRVPHLSALGAHTVVFPHVYNTFPGTLRSHVPLMTGGPSITWGSIYDELAYRYTGPTLVGELQDLGYLMGLFSAAYMDAAEDLGAFYDTLPFDRRFYPRMAPEVVERHQVNSWGIDERVVLERALSWIDARPEAKRPFFLNLLTSSNHHPYDVPGDLEGSRPEADRQVRYLNALRFVDGVLGTLQTGLERRGLLDGTLVFVMGDHGEAFGELHATNLTHNQLYEENVRNFVLMLDFLRRDGPLVVPQVLALGDVGPSILSLIGDKERPFMKPSAFAPDFRERIVYFHRNTVPQKWGLRDGRWKFITRRVGAPHPELYDLVNDPDEKQNLAAQHPDWVSEYSALVSQWYIRLNDEFTSRLEGFSHIDGEGLAVEDIQSDGPKRMAFGFDPPGLKKFEPLALIHPDEELIVWTHGPAYSRDELLNYAWTSPRGTTRNFVFNVREGWSTVWVYHSPPASMEEGPWHLVISQGGQPIIEGDFVVSRDAPLHNRRDFSRVR